MTDAELHPDVAALRFLLGRWVGEGRGEYPTIDPFTYGEELRFWHVGKPFLAYSQRTWHVVDGRPLHSETGYWRLPGGGPVLELLLAHPTGVIEVEQGAVEGSRIELATTDVVRTPSAKEVTALARTIEVHGDVMTYALRMAAVGRSLEPHLTAELRRQAG